MPSRSNRRVLPLLRNLCILFSLLLASHVALADSVGSDSAVSIQSHYDFPANPLILSNIINGFAWMKNGFEFEDNTTACTFNSVFPVSGLVSLNGGTLYLSSDLLFSEGAVLQNLGSFVGVTSKVIDLANTTTLIPNGSYDARLQNIEVGFDQDLTLAGTLYINGAVEIDGRSNVLTLSNNGFVIIENNSILTLNDLTIVGANENNIRCVNESGRLVLDDVIWYQDSNVFTFTQGSISIHNQAEVIGTATFHYASASTATVHKNSVWKFSDGMLLKIGRQTTSLTSQPLYLEDPNSTLGFDNADMLVTASGMSLTRGRIAIDGEAILDVTNSGTTYGLVLGDGTADGDLQINFGPGTIATFNTGSVTSKLLSQGAFNSASVNTKIIRGPNSYFNLEEDFTFRNVTVQIDPDSDLDVAFSKRLFYNNSTLRLPDGVITLNGERINPYTSVIQDGGDILIIRGDLPLDTIIRGSVNEIRGSGSISGALTLSTSIAVVDINYNGLLNTDIVLNGGTVLLSGDLNFVGDHAFSGSGLVNLNQSVLSLGAKDLTWGSSVYLDSDHGTIKLNSKTTLSSTVTFSGYCTLDGNGNELSFNSTGLLYVENGSTLKLKNIKLTDMSTSSIQCLDNQSQIILEDTMLLVSNQVTFTMGSILIEGEVEFVGTGTFRFSSPGSISISPAALMYAHNLTFELGKLTQTHPEALIFQDANATLKLDNATLHIINQGLRAKVGKVVYSNDIIVSMDSTDSTNGIIIGDGTPENDLVLEFLAGTNVVFAAGHTAFEMSSANRFISHSKTAKIKRLVTSNYYINNDLIINNITIDTANGSVLYVAPGKSLYYNDISVIAGDYAFDLTGTRYNFYTNLLGGNNQIYMTKGNLPAYTRVSGTNNSINGIGNIDGLVYLTGPTAALTFGFDGKIAQSILFNGGTVNLTRNLSLAYNSVCNGPGTLNLANNTLVLGGQDCNWTGSLYIAGTTGGMQLNANMNLSSTLTFSGNVSIDGRYHQITLAPTAQIVVEQGSTLTLRNLTLDALSGAKLCCANNQSKIILENVLCRLDGQYTFTIGSIDIREQNDFTGTSTFTYLSPSSMTIKSASQATIENICLSMGRASTGGNEPVVFESTSSILHLKSCGLDILNNGWRALSGSVFCENDLMVTLHSTDTSNGFMLGDGTADGDPLISYIPGATITYNAGHYYFKYYNPGLLTSRSSITKVIRMPGSTFYFDASSIFQNISIDARTGAVTTVAPGAALDYDKCTILGNGFTFDLTARRYNSYTNVLNGNKEISLTKGAMPMYTLVDGTGNIIRGSGDLSGQLSLTNSSAALTISLDGNIYQSVPLRGGSVTITRDLEMAHDAIFSGSGNIILQTAALSFGLQETCLTSTLFLDSTESTLAIRNKVVLSGTITASGLLTVDGKSNTLEFAPTGEFIVYPGSTVHFKDITLKNIAGINLRAADSSSTIILENSYLVLSNDYSFTAGTLIMEDDCYFSGAYTFTLSSPHPAQVQAYSSMILEDGLVLAVGRYGDINGTEPIDFENSTSKLVLKTCVFSVMPTGMSLLRCHMLFVEDSGVQVHSTSTTDGLILGDGTAENDPTLSWLSGSRMNYSLGHVTYNCASPTQFESFSKTSNLKAGANTYFYAQENCVLSTVNLDSHPLGVLDMAPGKYFLYNDCLIDSAGQQFNLTGKSYNFYTFWLDGDSDLLLTRGTYYAYTLVSGSNNSFRGTGDIANPIILSDPSASVGFNLNGRVLSSIQMNGGTVQLNGEMHLANDATFDGIGTVNLQSNILHTGHRDLTITNTILFQGIDGATYNFNGSRSLAGSWTFSGAITIDGKNAHKLDLDTTGQITVAEDSTLIFKDIVLKNVHDTNILCASDSSTIIFDNVTLELSNDYTFSVGAFVVHNLLEVNGSYSFIYTSSQASHIGVRAMACFCEAALSYAPTTTANNLLVLDDNESIIRLMDSTLLITATGLQLTTGQFVVQGMSSLQSSDTTAQLILGDNDASRDCNLDIRNSSLFTIQSGLLTYKNISPTSFILDGSSLIDVGSQGGLALYYNLTNNSGMVRFYENALLQRVPDATLNVPIQLLGQLAYDVLS